MLQAFLGFDPAELLKSSQHVLKDSSSRIHWSDCPRCAGNIWELAWMSMAQIGLLPSSGVRVVEWELPPAPMQAGAGTEVGGKDPDRLSRLKRAC